MIKLLLVIALLLSFQGDGISKCQEDMSCWNCETMGNLVCGYDTN